MAQPEVPPPLAGAPTNEQLGIPGWLEPLMWVTVVIVAIWLASSIFIHMRRRAVNLTPTQDAKVKKEAAPDFLTVDHKAREAAMKRGEAYDEKLVEREKAEALAAAGKPEKKDGVSLMQSIAGIASFLFSLFSLAGVLVNVFSQMDRIGNTVGQSGNMWVAVTKNPIPTVICLFVIGYTLWYWISKKKWLEPPKI